MVAATARAGSWSEVTAQPVPGSAVAGLRGCGALEDILTEAAVDIENIAQASRTRSCAAASGN